MSADKYKMFFEKLKLYFKDALKRISKLFTANRANYCSYVFCYMRTNSAAIRSSYKNEQGFIIVVALLALLLLTAVGALVFNLTTQDIRVSTRSIGEKKAFSAAQAGIHILSVQSNANAGIIGNFLVSVPSQIDPAADPATRYTIGDVNIPGVPPSLPMAGYEITGSKSWGQTVTPKSVTGLNQNYNSRVTIDVGIGYGPIEISTQQPAAGG